jgi:hypothetical protein
MSRGLTSTEQSLVAASHRISIALVELNFRSGTLRLAMSPWDISDGTNVWVATGALLRIDPPRESASSTEGLQFTMSGLVQTILTLADTENYQGRLVRLLKAHVDPNTNQIASSGGSPIPPKEWFIGRMRRMNTEDLNSRVTVTLVAEHYEAELGRANPVRMNDANQQRRAPGDRGFEFVEEMTEIKLSWPDRNALIKASRTSG